MSVRARPAARRIPHRSPLVTREQGANRAGRHPLLSAKGTHLWCRHRGPCHWRTRGKALKRDGRQRAFGRRHPPASLESHPRTGQDSRPQIRAGAGARREQRGRHTCGRMSSLSSESLVAAWKKARATCTALHSSFGWFGIAPAGLLKLAVAGASRIRLRGSCYWEQEGRPAPLHRLVLRRPVPGTPLRRHVPATRPTWPPPAPRWRPRPVARAGRPPLGCGSASLARATCPGHCP